MKVKFSYAYAGVALVLAGLFGCDRDSSRSGTRQSANAPSTEPTTREYVTTAPAADENDPRRLDTTLSPAEVASLLEEGAKHEAKRLFLPICSVSGDNYFCRLGFASPMQQFREVTLTVRHFSGGRFQPGPAPLTDIDRLNGVFWSGTVSFCCKAYRSLNEDLRTQTMTWNDWQPGDRLDHGHFFYTDLVLKKDGWTTRSEKADTPQPPINLRMLPGLDRISPIPSPCDTKKVTPANYNGIIVYMPIMQVKGILGPWSDVEIQNALNTTIHWRLEDGVSEVLVQFTDGRVFMKCRRGFGLTQESIMNPGIEKLK